MMEEDGDYSMWQEMAEHWDDFFEQTAWVGRRALKRELSIELPGEPHDKYLESPAHYRVLEGREWLVTWQVPLCNALVAAFREPNEANLARLNDATRKMDAMSAKMRSFKEELAQHADFICRFKD